MLLYELLTGVTPFDTQMLAKAAWDEVQRVIRDTDPPKPSTRLQTLGHRLKQVAQRRQTEPASLSRLVRGDLDWIVMKCLEKERVRRYETASAMALDIQNYLDQRPVTAVAPTLRYRFSKFARRNRTALVTATAFVLLLIAGSVISIYEAVRATQHAAAARQQAARASQLAQAESRQRQLASASAQESRARLVTLHVDSGNRLLEHGDYFGALAWFAEALNLDRDRPDKLEIHKLRLTSVIKHSPSLLQLWFHEGPVNSAEFSNNGLYVATAGRDTLARVWDASTGQALAPPLQHPLPVLQVQFSPDSRRMLTRTRDQVRVWAIPSGQLLGTLDHQRINDASFSPDGTRLVTASEDGIAKFWDAMSFAPVGPVLRHNGAILQAEWPPKNQQLLTASADQTARIWDVTTGKIVQEFTHVRPVRHARFQPQGSKIVTTAYHAFLWDPTSSTNVIPLLRHSQDGVRHVTVSRDGRYVATSGSDGVTRIWTTDTGQLIHTLGSEDHSEMLESAFSPDGTLIISSQSSGRASIWTVQNGRPVSPCLRLSAIPTCIRFHPDGRRVLAAASDGSVRIWDLAPETLASCPWPENSRRLVDWSPDGYRIVIQDGNGPSTIWNLRSGQAEGASLNTSNKVVQIFCPDESGALLTIEDMAPPMLWEGGPVRLHQWQLANGQLTDQAQFLLTPMYGKHPLLLRFNATGSQIAFAHTNCLVVYDRIKGAELWHSAPHFPSPAWAISYSPNGDRLAINCRNLVHVFDAATGREVFSPLTNKLSVVWTEFSPDGRLLVSAAADNSLESGEARVWQADSGQLLWTFSHHAGVRWATFSPESSRLATAGDDHIVRIWSLTNGLPLTPPLNHNSVAFTCAFSPDGRMLATGTHDEVARVWDAESGAPITPPLRHSGAVIQVFFLKSLPYLVSETYGGFYLWNLRPYTGSQSQLIARAQLLAAHRVQTGGGLEALDCRSLSNSWQLWRNERTGEAWQQNNSPNFRRVPGGLVRPPGPIPPRDPGTPVNLLDLTPHYNWTLADGWDPIGPGVDLRSLPIGPHELAGVDFDLRGVIRLSSSELERQSELSYPKQITGIKVGQKCRRIHFLHSTGWIGSDGTIIARYLLHHANGTQTEIPVVYGEALRGWFLSSDPSTKLSSSKVAWVGTSSAAFSIRLFLFSVTNPLPEVELSSLDLQSTMTGSCPFVLAITVE